MYCVICKSEEVLNKLRTNESSRVSTLLSLENDERFLYKSSPCKKYQLNTYSLALETSSAVFSILTHISLEKKVRKKITSLQKDKNTLAFIGKTRDLQMTNLGTSQTAGPRTFRLSSYILTETTRLSRLSKPAHALILLRKM